MVWGLLESLKQPLVLLKVFGRFTGMRQLFGRSCCYRFLLPFSFVIASSLANWVALISVLLLLLLVEVINSAIEALADQISTDFHELLGRAKDLGSSAVFIALTMVALVWGASMYTYFVG